MKLYLFFIPLWCGVAVAQAQQPPSVTVNDDMTVTYRVTAPNAKEVSLIDSILTPEPGVPMTRGSDGVWTATVGPYEAGDHQYGFVIDGVRTGDTGPGLNTNRLPRPAILFETVQVRGAEPLAFDLQKVPHGTVHIETFSSTHFAREVQCYVYTPPGYSNSGKHYPVLYLLHGGFMEVALWTRGAGADRTADDLIAAGQSPEVIIAMPDTNTSNRLAQPLPLTERYLLDEVIPFVEGKYRAGPVRYLAGLSGGAIHTRNIGLRNPEAFSALGIFSGGGFPAGDPPLEQSYPKLLDAAAINQQLPMIYIAVGNQDAAQANVERLRDSFARLGIKHHFNLSSGGHTIFNWQRYLPEFLKGLQ